MDFTLSKEHEMARQLFKDFAENEVKPLAQEVDETEVFPAKFGIVTARCHQLLMRSLLCDPSFIHHKDQICVSHAKGTVCNEKRRVLFGERFKCVLYARLGNGIKRCHCFIKDEHGTTLQQRSCNTDLLSAPLGQRNAVP